MGDVIAFDEFADPASAGSLELNDDVFARLLVIVGLPVVVLLTTTAVVENIVLKRRRQT